MVESRRPEYHAAQGHNWQPIATYTLMGIIVAVFILQMLTLARDPQLHRTLFVIDSQWTIYPWTLITATLSHGSIPHILLNGIVLFFFGPILERLIGWQKFVLLFFVSGAIASLAQVYFNLIIFNIDPGGLGASGALFMILGALVVIMPNEKILIWGILPVPFWAAAVGFAALDIIGALNPLGGVGNIAHLSGMAIGLWYGWRLRETMKKQGLRLMHG